MRVLGLDISTSCVGVAIVDGTSADDITVHKLDHISFTSKEKSIWEKIDFVQKVLNTVASVEKVDAIFAEDAMVRFKPGQSSAQTISLLLRFNSLVSYVARHEFSIDTEFISVNHARKLCGVKTQFVSKCGKSHKQQTFDHMRASVFKDWNWPLKKRSTNIVGWAYDEVDAYVIAAAGLITKAQT